MYPGTERQGSIDTILHSRGLSRRIAVTVPHYLRYRRDRREIELARRRPRGDGPPIGAIAPAQNLRSSHRAPRHHDHDDLERACPIRSRAPLVLRMHRHRERGAHLIKQYVILG